MIKLLIVFIVLYISFTAIALNYAKAFKVKNNVIQYIEDREITSIEKISAKGDAELTNYIRNTIVEEMNYSISKGICMKKTETKLNGCKQVKCESGIEIDECKTNDGNKKGTYYIVTTAFGWDIPFLNVLLKLNDETSDNASGFWTISGETRTIVSEDK